MFVHLILRYLDFYQGLSMYNVLKLQFKNFNISKTDLQIQIMCLLISKFTLRLFLIYNL